MFVFLHCFRSSYKFYLLLVVSCVHFTFDFFLVLLIPFSCRNRHHALWSVPNPNFLITFPRFLHNSILVGIDGIGLAGW